LSITSLAEKTTPCLYDIMKIIKSSKYKESQFGANIDQWESDALADEKEREYYEDLRRDWYDEEPEGLHNTFNQYAYQLDEAKNALLAGDISQSPSRRHMAVLADLEQALEQFKTNWQMANELEGRG